MRFIKIHLTVTLIVLTAFGCRTAIPPQKLDLTTLPTSELLHLLARFYQPDERIGLPYEICEELSQRGNVTELLAAFQKMRNEEARGMLVERVLYHIDDDRIAREFANRLNEDVTEESYYVANYLAKRGDKAALATLNRHFFDYPVSSWQWSYSVELFAKYKYRPAVTNLVESLDAASLNWAAAAAQALEEIFPDAPKANTFGGPKEMQEHYRKRLGLKQASE